MHSHIHPALWIRHWTTSGYVSSGVSDIGCRELFTHGIYRWGRRPCHRWNGLRKMEESIYPWSHATLPNRRRNDANQYWDVSIIQYVRLPSYSSSLFQQWSQCHFESFRKNDLERLRTNARCDPCLVTGQRTRIEVFCQLEIHDGGKCYIPNDAHYARCSSLEYIVLLCHSKVLCTIEHHHTTEWNSLSITERHCVRLLLTRINLTLITVVFLLGFLYQSVSKLELSRRLCREMDVRRIADAIGFVSDEICNERHNRNHEGEGESVAIITPFASLRDSITFVGRITNFNNKWISQNDNHAWGDWDWRRWSWAGVVRRKKENHWQVQLHWQ